MVAGVIIGVATQDIEDQTAEQLAQGGLRTLEAMADDFGQLIVCSNRQLVQRGLLRLPWLVLRGGQLKIKCADPV
jgi:hypothetical protein